MAEPPVPLRLVRHRRALGRSAFFAILLLELVLGRGEGFSGSADATLRGLLTAEGRLARRHMEDSARARLANGHDIEWLVAHERHIGRDVIADKVAREEFLVADIAGERIGRLRWSSARQ
jgi:hypothetical protein